MGSDVSRTRHQAIVIPETVEIWSSESSFSESSPAAGLPVPTASTQLALTASGPQTADMVIRTITPGLPTGGAYSDGGALVHSGARQIWRASDDSSSSFRGHDPGRTASSGFQPILWDDATIVTAEEPDAATHAIDDTVIAVLQLHDNNAVGGSHRLEAFVRSPSAHTWARVLIEGGTAPSSDFVPCIVALPSGRMQVYRVIEDPSGDHLLRMWFTDDSGTTWSFGGDGVLDAAIPSGSSPVRMRAAYADGQIALVVRTTAKVTLYASSDLGLTFQEVGDFAGNGVPTPANFDVCPSPFGGFVCAIIGETAAAGVEVVLLGDAYEPPGVAQKVALTSSTTTIASVTVDEDLTVSMDATGLLTLIARDGENLLAQLSYDGGITWGDYVVGAATGDVAAYGGTGSSYLGSLKAVHQRGRTLLLCAWSAGGTTTTGGRLGCLYLGGWSQVTVPSSRVALVDQAAQGWSGVWYPTEIPDVASGWTAAGLGTSSLTAQVLQISTDIGQTLSYSRNPGTGTLAVQFTLSTTFGDETTDRVAVEIVHNGGSHIKIRFSTTGYTVYDVISAATVGSGTIDMTSAAQIWVEMDVGANGRVGVWHRIHDWSEDRQWGAGPTSTTLGKSGSPTPAVTWGHLAAPIVNGRTSDWSEFKWANATARASSLAPGFVNPTDLRGRMITGDPYHGQGLRLRARHGPSYRGEEWTVEARADYRIENLIEVDSPRVGWRSTSTAAQEIALKWDEAVTPGGRSILAVMLRDSNIPTVELEGHNGSAWVSIGTADLTFGTLSFTRTGSAAVPGATGANPYLRHGEIAGGTLAYSATVARRIAKHSEGVWDSAASLRPVLRLSGVDDGADPANGAAATVIPAQAVILVELSTDYKAIKLKIPVAAGNQAPAEGYWECGTLVAGWAYPLGYDTSWGRVQVTEHPSEVVTTRDRQNRVISVAPPVRSTTISWTDGIDQTEVESDTADPDWVTLDSEAGAARDGTAYALDGMLREIAGAVGTIVYLPRVADLASGIVVLNRRRDAIHGRINQLYRREAAQGDEHVDEVQRIASITIDEEV